LNLNLQEFIPGKWSRVSRACETMFEESDILVIDDGFYCCKVGITVPLFRSEIFFFLNNNPKGMVEMINLEHIFLQLVLSSSIHEN
jgi:hypothetical protein